MGFTGYSLELLVILQNGFASALQAIKTLQENPIDIQGRSLDALQQTPAFKDNHIFIIDPTDTNRNVASSFSKRSYVWLQAMTNRLLDIPETGGEEFTNLIIEQPISTDPLPSWLKNHSFTYAFTSDGSIHYTILRDKLYRHARKVASRLKTERTGEERFGQILFEVCYNDSRFALGFLIEKLKVSDTYSRRGPPIGIEGSKRFADAHDNTFEQNGYLWVEERRKWTVAKDLLSEFIGKHNIKGLSLDSDETELEAQVSNVLFKYVLPIEPGFPLKATV
jgi:tRNA nucleotidyltransferase (CCA-adding enzyme)